jgi:thioredoxin 1
MSGGDRKEKESRRMAGANTLEVTDATFDSTIESAQGLAIVDFWAEWCGPCRIIGPFVDQLAEQYADKGLVVGKVDVDVNPGMSGRFGIRSIPSVLFFKDGKHVDTVVGAVPKAYLEKKVLEHL